MNANNPNDVLVLIRMLTNLHEPGATNAIRQAVNSMFPPTLPIPEPQNDERQYADLSSQEISYLSTACMVVMKMYRTRNKCDMQPAAQAILADLQGGWLKRAAQKTPAK